MTANRAARERRLAENERRLAQLERELAAQHDESEPLHFRAMNMHERAAEIHDAMEALLSDGGGTLESSNESNRERRASDVVPWLHASRSACVVRRSTSMRARAVAAPCETRGQSHDDARERGSCR